MFFFLLFLVEELDFHELNVHMIRLYCIHLSWFPNHIIPTRLCTGEGKSCVLCALFIFGFLPPITFFGPRELVIIAVVAILEVDIEVALTMRSALCEYFRCIN